jgi:hypothetical protein
MIIVYLLTVVVTIRGLSTSPPLSPSPYEVSKERGDIKKRGFASLGLLE